MAGKKVGKPAVSPEKNQGKSSSSLPKDGAQQTYQSVFELAFADLDTDKSTVESKLEIKPKGMLLPGVMSSHPLIDERASEREGKKAYGTRVQTPGGGVRFGQIRIKKIVGDGNGPPVDDRTQVTDASNYPYGSHCLLHGHVPGGYIEGTGWPVAPRVLITAGHCVLHPKIGSFIKSMDVYRAPTNGQLGQPDAKAVRVETTTAWRTQWNKPQDFAVVYLDRDICTPDETFELKIASPEELLQMRVNIIGYPTDKPDGTMWQDANLITSVSNGQINYLVDTMEGNSGGPVLFVDDNEYVYSVGIHNYGDFSFNTATQITQKVADQINAWIQQQP